MATTLRTALDQLLGGGGTLESFVRQRRAASTSWRRIAVDLYDETKVDVSHEVLRQWFPDRETAA